MQTSWSTNGFWQGSSIDALWHIIIEEWLKEKTDEDEEREHRLILDRKLATINAGLYDLFESQEVMLSWVDEVEGIAFTHQIKSRLSELVCETYRSESTQKKDTRRIIFSLPKSPDEAVGLDTLSERWGLSMDYIQTLLHESSMNVVRLNGWIASKKYYAHNRYYRDHDPIQCCLPFRTVGKN